MRRRSRGSGRPVSRRKLLLGAGAALSGAGLISTGAFSTVDAPRSSTLSTTSDPKALLGLDGYADSSVTPTVTNNSSYSMDVTLDSAESVEFDVGTNGTYETPPVTFTLASGASKEVNIKYTGQCTNAGSAVVSSDAILQDGARSVGSISLTREWQIPASGQVQFNGTANSAGQSGKYEFDLENTGCEDVTFVGIGIKETTANADYVSGSGSLYDSTNTELVTNSIPVDNSAPDSDTRRDLNSPVTLAQNATLTWEFDRFKNEQNQGADQNVDMRGEDVKVKLYLSDGSTATEKLCLGTCDF